MARSTSAAVARAIAIGAARSTSAAVAFAITVASCDYRAVYGGTPQTRWHVSITRSLIGDASAADEIAIGVREELAQAGNLAAGEGYPRVEIEVVREDHASEGIQAARGGQTGPMARAVDVGVVARAWIARSAGEALELDTSDVRAEVTIAEAIGRGAADPRRAIFEDADGLRAAARRLGHKLAARLLGLGSTTEERIESP